MRTRVRAQEVCHPSDTNSVYDVQDKELDRFSTGTRVFADDHYTLVTA